MKIASVISNDVQCPKSVEKQLFLSFLISVCVYVCVSNRSGEGGRRQGNLLFYARQVINRASLRALKLHLYGRR